MSKLESVECRLTLLTRWEGIGLYALTFTTMTQKNFCGVISPLELNTRSIPFPIVMLVLRDLFYANFFENFAKGWKYGVKNAKLAKSQDLVI